MYSDTLLLHRIKYTKRFLRKLQKKSEGFYSFAYFKSDREETKRKLTLTECVTREKKGKKKNKQQKKLQGNKSKLLKMKNSKNHSKKRKK